MKKLLILEVIKEVLDEARYYPEDGETFEDGLYRAIKELENEYAVEQNFSCLNDTKRCSECGENC